MPLSKEEIVPGVVAFLDTARLCKDPRVKCVTGKTEFRSGPYLCVHVKDDISIWLNLTSRRGTRRPRFKLERHWRVGGGYRWQRDDSYVYDAGMPFVGLNDALVDASIAELPLDSGQRPYLSDEGLAAVEEEMRKAGVSRLWELVQRGIHFGLKRPLHHTST